MFKNAILFTLILFLFTSCQKEQYNLRWKVQKYSPVVFETQMEFIDSLCFISEEHNLIRMMESIAGSFTHKTSTPMDVSGLKSDIVSDLNTYKHFTILKKETNGINIDLIERLRKRNYANAESGEETPQEQYSLVGEILNNGKLDIPNHSPIFIIMFELPIDPVSIGDTWTLNLNLDTKNKNKDIKPNKSKNLVTFVDLLKKGDELIAILQYDIISQKEMAYNNSGFSAIQFKGKGDFNITKGIWEKFEGYYITEIATINKIKLTQKIKLTEISMAKFFSLKPVKPQTLNKLPVKKEEATKNSIAKKQVRDKQIVKKNKIVNLTKKADCPSLYSIQILATKLPVLTGSKEFKNFNYKVQEKISNKSNDTYKYKYTVGNFCSIDKARKKLIEIRNSGFPRSFITKRVNK